MEVTSVNKNLQVKRYVVKSSADDIAVLRQLAEEQFIAKSATPKAYELREINGTVYVYAKAGWFYRESLECVFSKSAPELVDMTLPPVVRQVAATDSPAVNDAASMASLKRMNIDIGDVIANFDRSKMRHVASG